MFCILLPVAMSPALVVLFIGDHRAKKMGLASSQLRSHLQPEDADYIAPVQRTKMESIRFYWTRLNVFGLLLMGFGFALLLTPITLSTTAKGGYTNREHEYSRLP